MTLGLMILPSDSLGPGSFRAAPEKPGFFCVYFVLCFYCRQRGEDAPTPLSAHEPGGAASPAHTRIGPKVFLSYKKNIYRANKFGPDLRRGPGSRHRRAFAWRNNGWSPHPGDFEIAINNQYESPGTRL